MVICPDCIIARETIARHGFAPLRHGPREATEPVTTYDGRRFLVCWAHEVLYRWGRPPIVPIG